MAIKIKQKIVIEDIIDEEGNKLGEIRFNPNDSRITAKLVKIFEEIQLSLKKIDNLDIKKININVDKLESYEDFEQTRDSFNDLCEAFKIENEVIENVKKELSEIFSKETIDLFTAGTNDIESLVPLFDAIEPYLKEARKKETIKYMPKDNDVME